MVTEPILLDSTAKQFLEVINKQTNILASMSIGNTPATLSSYQSIANIVRDGYADKVFNIGDQIFVDWVDVSTNTSYNVPLNITHFGTIVTETGEEFPAMYLQWHYCTPFGIQFDNLEAFYSAEQEVLPAGTYNIIIGDNWGANVIKGKTYQFTLTQDLQIGGQLSGFEYLNGTAPSNWTVKSFKNSSTITPLETVPVIEGSEGINLGTMSFGAKDGKLNAMQAVGYGYNNWGKSAIRQWLNSSLGKNVWWKAQHKWDRPPVELANVAGFLTGFPDEFLGIIKPVRVRTASNTVNDDGTFYDTYDKFFIPSLEEMYIKQQITGEGETWAYWKEASGRTEPISWYPEYTAPITYAINAKTSPQHVRLRSANRGYGNYTWYIGSGGYVNSDRAYCSCRLSPACVIY